MSVPRVTQQAAQAQAPPRTAVAFTVGLHAAFYASMGFMALAAGLSALRVRRS